jgi:hypothetical protein
MQIFTGWVITIAVACAIGSLLTALGVNSPNRQSIDQIIGANEVGLRTDSCLPTHCCGIYLQRMEMQCCTLLTW